jgi:hypothetical protein
VEGGNEAEAVLLCRVEAVEEAGRDQRSINPSVEIPLTRFLPFVAVTDRQSLNGGEGRGSEDAAELFR